MGQDSSLVQLPIIQRQPLSAPSPIHIKQKALMQLLGVGLSLALSIGDLFFLGSFIADVTFFAFDLFGLAFAGHIHIPLYCMQSEKPGYYITNTYEQCYVHKQK